MRVRVCACTQSLSHVQLFAIPWTVARQAPLSMEFSRQEYWNGLPFPSPWESSQPRNQTQVSCISYTTGGFFTAEPTWEAQGLAYLSAMSISIDIFL